MPVDRRPHERRASLTDRASRRLKASAFGRGVAARVDVLRTRILPVHWTNVFGAASLAALAVLFVTGILLMFFYVPSSAHVTYHGAWAPLDGVSVSQAFDSTMRVSFEVRGGLLVRQLHHWAALLLPSTVILQLLVSFFTAGFRRPRRGAWVVLFLFFLAALVAGWSGYALPDDMLSGTGLRIVQGIVVGIPIVGVWASNLLFGGEFPGQIIEHLYPVHVLVAPGALLLLAWLMLRAVRRTGLPQYAGPGRNERNTVGLPMWPNGAMRVAGTGAVVGGLLVLISATVTVAPIWLFGPSDPGNASAGSQPDWYTGFLDGALRLIPPGWEMVAFGRTWVLAILVPLAVIGLFLLAILMYPFVEEWVTGDSRAHNILDRPRNAPTRTGLGVAAIIFYCALWGAGSADVMALGFHLSLESVIAFFRGLALLGPLFGFLVTERVCVALQKKDRDVLLHGYESGRIVRLPGGRYSEVHRAVPVAERWRYTGPASATPYLARPDERGRVRPGVRLRAGLSRFFFRDRIAPLDELPSPDQPQSLEPAGNGRGGSDADDR